MRSKVLNHCWVCGQRFSDQTPPGPATREEHHIIPQAYGGADGPTVSLCSNHHNMLHAVAVALKNRKPYFDLIGGLTTEQQQKVMVLANYVFEAEQATRNDPNKIFLVSLTANRTQIAKMERLKKVFPKARSRQAILLLALEHLYNSTFLEKK